ncbi:hypothetical protein AB0H20_05695 [Nocardia fluminea]
MAGLPDVIAHCVLTISTAVVLIIAKSAARKIFGSATADARLT